MEDKQIKQNKGCQCGCCEKQYECDNPQEMCENIDLHPHEQCQCKHKHRSENERKTMINRLRRIEGQVRGLEKMVENDAYCTDIVTQVSAVQAALNAFSKQLLANHIQTCVIQDIRSGKDEVVEDLIHTIHKLMK